MITEQDLREAIAECQGQPNPTSKTCVKLAAFQYLLDRMNKHVDIPAYSYSAKPDTYQSDTKFGQLIRGKDINEVLSVVEELVEATEAYNPPLYRSFIRKLQ